LGLLGSRAWARSSDLRGQVLGRAKTYLHYANVYVGRRRAGMNSVRRKALRNVFLALLLMAPVIGYALAIDYVNHNLWRPSDGFAVALLTPGLLALLRSGYALIMGRAGPFPLFGPKPADW
jgi:hypothetical protein